MQQLPNYYAILGVSRYASQDEIKQAYEQLANQYDAKRNGGVVTSRMPEIKAAYDVLRNSGKRARYDANYNELASLGPLHVEPPAPARPSRSEAVNRPESPDYVPAESDEIMDIAGPPAPRPEPLPTPSTTSTRNQDASYTTGKKSMGGAINWLIPIGIFIIIRVLSELRG